MSASSWRRLDESSYLLDEPHGDPFSPPNGIDPFDPRALLSSDEDDEDDEEALSLPSAGVANVRGETPDPDLDEEDVDIREFDWRDADKEVNDFLAELGEDGGFSTDDSDNERYSHMRIPLNIVWRRIILGVPQTSGNENETGSPRERLQIQKTQMATVSLTTIQKIYALV